MRLRVVVVKNNQKGKSTKTVVAPEAMNVPSIMVPAYVMKLVPRRFQWT